MSREFSIFNAFFKFDKKRITISLMLSVINSLILLPVGFIIQYVFEHAFIQADSKLLLKGIAGIFGLLLINTSIILLNRHVTLSVIKSFIFDLRTKVIHRILFLHSSYFLNENLDDIQVKVVQDTERVDNMLAAFLTQLLPGFFVFISLSGVMIYMNFQLSLALMLVIPILYFAGKTVSKKLDLTIKQFHIDFSKFSEGATFILKFFELIKVSGAQQIEYANQKKILENLKQSSKQVAYYASAFTTIQGNLFLVGTFGVLLLGGLQIINGITTPGSLVSYYVILNLASSHMKTVISFIPVLLEGRNSVTSLNEILNNENVENSSDVEIQFQQSIKFQHISFYYGEKFVFEKLSFEIKKGQMFGITGHSGAGKSTLIKLILGFYSTKSGEVFIDGKNVSQSDLVHFRNKVGYLPQDPMFFAGSIRDNLIYGLKDETNEFIYNTSRSCKIHDFILSLPDGYNSEIGNSGNMISGGQRQRIAIARALLRKPQLLILDEPDKNLDEQNIREILHYLKKEKITTILISHNKKILVGLDHVMELNVT